MSGCPRRSCCWRVAGSNGWSPDAGISDPTTLDDASLAEAVEQLTVEEANVSEARGAVIAVLDTLQAELKRRYKDDPTLALR